MPVRSLFEFQRNPNNKHCTLKLGYRLGHGIVYQVRPFFHPTSFTYRLEPAWTRQSVCMRVYIIMCPYMRVCMCAYVYACMHVCMRACVHVCMCACVRAYV